MMNSKPHREAVLKVLKQAYVPHNTSIEKIDRLVGNVMMDNYISFSDDEIPLMAGEVPRHYILRPR